MRRLTPTVLTTTTTTMGTTLRARSFVVWSFYVCVRTRQALRHVGAFKDYVLGDEAAECLSARLRREHRTAGLATTTNGHGHGHAPRSMDPRDEILKFDDSIRKRKKRSGGGGGGDDGRKSGSSSSLSLNASYNASDEGGGKRRFAMRPPAMTRERRADMASAETLNVGGELRAVLRTLESGRYEAFPPYDLLKSVWKLVPAFAGNEQQDAHEFMRFLLDRLKKELNSGRHAVDMRGVVTPRQKEHSPCADGIPNPPTRARSVRSRSGRSSPSPSFLRDDDDDGDDASKRMREAIAGGATPVNGRVNRRDDGDGDEGFVIVSRWGAKRHKMGCACRPCKSRRRREEESGGGGGKAKGASGAATHLSSPTSSFASPSRLSRGVTASEVKKQLEETMRGERNASLPSTPVVAKSKSGTASSDKIMDMFGGVSITRITCMKCKNTNERREPFMDLSLPIPPVVSKNGSVPSTPLSPSTEPELGEGPNGEVTLQQCLAAFVRNETLSGHGRYFCDACGKVQNATKSTRIAKLPEVLSLHLKRFTWKGHESRTKLTNDVDFPLEDLDLAPYCELDVVSDAAPTSKAPPASPDRSKARRTPRRSASAAAKSDLLYDLIAVVTHHGTSAGSGHYTACCRDVSSPSTNDWQHFNDDEVNPLTAEEVRTGQGYIFLYARKPKKH